MEAIISASQLCNALSKLTEQTEDDIILFFVVNACLSSVKTKMKERLVIVLKEIEKKHETLESRVHKLSTLPDDERRIKDSIADDTPTLVIRDKITMTFKCMNDGSALVHLNAPSSIQKAFQFEEDKVYRLGDPRVYQEIQSIYETISKGN